MFGLKRVCPPSNLVYDACVLNDRFKLTAMRKWCVITVLLYVLLLVALTFPVAYIGTLDWSITPSGTLVPKTDHSLDIFELFSEPGYYVWLGVMGLCQLLLLLVPLDTVQERPVARRKLWVPVVTGSFLFANLVFAGICCLLFAHYGDEGLEKLLFWANFGTPVNELSPVASQTQKFLGISLSESDRHVLCSLCILLFLWLVWGWIFHRVSRNHDAPTTMKKIFHWLHQGSILEFLVALPSHIIVRERNECCAPVGTFWGIAAGLSIMFLCYGPGVLFLFAARFRRLQPKATASLDTSSH